MPGVKLVRPSKFRHVFGTAAKKEACYDGAQVSLDSNDWHLIKGNDKYLSIHWDSAAGGAFLIHPQGTFGKIENPPPGLYIGHAGSVLDTDFHPFDNDLIASAGEDGKILLWKISEEISPDKKTSWISEYKGHERRVVDLAWSPIVDSLLASASHDMTVRLWDVKSAKETPTITLTGHQDAVLDQCWSQLGDRLITSSRDKSLRIFDPRRGDKSVMEKKSAHNGIKGMRVVWLGEGEQLISTGFGRGSEREISLWDSRKFIDPLTTIQLDSASGALLPFYDADCRMLYVAGRGEGAIRYYELISDSNSIYFLNEYRSPEPQRGLCMLPKRTVSVTDNEIARFIKVHGSQPILEPISFKVPRRDSGTGSFSSDIYPDTLAPEPALSSAEFFAGVVKQPRRVSLENLRSIQSSRRPSNSVSTLTITATSNIDEEAEGEESLKGALIKLRLEIKKLHEELDEKSARIEQLEAEVKQSS